MTSSLPIPPVPSFNFGTEPNPQDKTNNAQHDAQWAELNVYLDSMRTLFNGFLRDDDTMQDDYVRMRMLHPEVRNAIQQGTEIEPGIPYGQILYSDGFNNITSNEFMKWSDTKGLYIHPDYWLSAKQFMWDCIVRQTFETIAEDATTEDQWHTFYNYYLEDGIVPTDPRHYVHKQYVDDAVSDAEGDLQTQIDDLSVLIAANAADIATNVGDIATNAANIATNVSNIATNAANITTNVTDIDALEAWRAIMDALNGIVVGNGAGAYSAIALTGDGADVLDGTGTFVAASTLALVTAPVASGYANPVAEITRIANGNFSQQTSWLDILGESEAFNARQRLITMRDGTFQDVNPTELTPSAAGGTANVPFHVYLYAESDSGGAVPYVKYWFMFEAFKPIFTGSVITDVEITGYTEQVILNGPAYTAGTKSGPFESPGDNTAIIPVDGAFHDMIRFVGATPPPVASWKIAFQVTGGKLQMRHELEIHDGIGSVSVASLNIAVKPMLLG